MAQFDSVRFSLGAGQNRKRERELLKENDWHHRFIALNWMNLRNWFLEFVGVVLVNFRSIIVINRHVCSFARPSWESWLKRETMSWIDYIAIFCICGFSDLMSGFAWTLHLDVCAKLTEKTHNWFECNKTVHVQMFRARMRYVNMPIYLTIHYIFEWHWTFAQHFIWPNKIIKRLATLNELFSFVFYCQTIKRSAKEIKKEKRKKKKSQW